MVAIEHDRTLVDLWQDPDPETASLERVYAIGDIHGRLDLLQSLEKAILQDMGARPVARAAICYLGDYIDRGPASAEVLAHLATPKADGISRVFLKGNHDERLLAFLVSPDKYGPDWVRYGGREALRSFGIEVSLEPDDREWQRVSDSLSNALGHAEKNFLRHLRLAFCWRNYLFVHAGINPDMPMTAQPCHDLMWIRDAFLESDRDYGRIIVHGHTISAEPDVQMNRIGIDTGAYSSGRLTCLILDDAGQNFIST
ncbi:MAG: serine/threonine protein phosphatase [Alphaproteobacteria bacterium]|nr:serine/threonine protein phosphatase [Alphaproteobacteria bacterium]